MTLPKFCINPHGMAIDAQHHIAFIACVDADPPSLVRVDLQTMSVIAEHPWPVQVKPDVLVFDRPSQLLFVGSSVGLSVFKENGRQLQWLGDYSFGLNTHTVAVDPATDDVYLPVPRLGNRPVLRIMHYYAADRPRRHSPSSAAPGRAETASAHTRVPPGRSISIHTWPGRWRWAV